MSITRMSSEYTERIRISRRVITPPRQAAKEDRQPPRRRITDPTFSGRAGTKPPVESRGPSGPPGLLQCLVICPARVARSRHLPRGYQCNDRQREQAREEHVESEVARSYHFATTG